MNKEEILKKFRENKDKRREFGSKRIRIFWVSISNILEQCEHLEI